jgi:hypothetical protein
VGAGTCSSVALAIAKASALSRKPGASPTRAINRPAMAGPTIRAPLKEAELRPTALATRSRPARSITNDWRAGWSTAFTTPQATAMTATCQ